MLSEERLDIVVVATPNDLHDRMTLDALAAGAHVVCEKPLGMNAAEAREMAATADSLGRVHFVPFVWRFVPAFAYATRLLGEGFVGTPYLVTVQYLNRGYGDPHGPMRWQFDKSRAGSGVLANLASHVVHLLDLWFGGVARVHAATSVKVPRRRLPDGALANADADDVLTMQAVLGDSDIPCSMAVTSVAYVGRNQLEISIFGSEGSLVISNDWSSPEAPTGTVRGMRRDEHVPARLVVPVRQPAQAFPSRGLYGPFRGAICDMAREVIGAVREGRRAAPDFWDGLRVQEVIDAALVSSATGQWVDIESHGAETSIGESLRRHSEH